MHKILRKKNNNEKTKMECDTNVKENYKISQEPCQLYLHQFKRKIEQTGARKHFWKFIRVWCACVSVEAGNGRVFECNGIQEQSPAVLVWQRWMAPDADASYRERSASSNATFIFHGENEMKRRRSPGIGYDASPNKQHCDRYLETNVRYVRGKWLVRKRNKYNWSKRELFAEQFTSCLSTFLSWRFGVFFWGTCIHFSHLCWINWHYGILSSSQVFVEEQKIICHILFFFFAVHFHQLPRCI